MKSLFSKEILEEINDRIDNLKNDSKPLWGKMNVSQMCSHCIKPLELALNDSDIASKPPLLKKLILSLFKKQMYNDKEWKKNLPTPNIFRVSDPTDFNREKDNLKSIIFEFHQKKDKTSWNEHPMFGKFTPEQWGIMQYKHIDHHLRQFDS